MPTSVIPESFADLLEKPYAAFVATVMPDGGPQVTPVWIMRDGDDLIINSARGRVKDKNLRRDGRVALCITDTADANRYLSIRGRVVEITEQGANAVISALALKYTGNPAFRPSKASEVRVTYRIKPESVATSS